MMKEKGWMDAIQEMADRERHSSDGIASAEIFELERISTANSGQLSPADSARVVWLALTAAHRYSNALAPVMSGRVKALTRTDIVEALRSIQAKGHKAQSAKGGRARHEKDPKQSAKAEALVLWKERHAGQHPKLRTVEQFAMEVMRRWPILKSANVIRRWSADWAKAAKNGTL